MLLFYLTTVPSKKFIRYIGPFPVTISINPLADDNDFSLVNIEGLCREYFQRFLNGAFFSSGMVEKYVGSQNFLLSVSRNGNPVEM